MLEQELSQMDRVSQLQDAIEEIFETMSESVKYISEHAPWVQVSEHIPITKTDPRAAPPEEFEAQLNAFAQQLVTNMKKIEFLIDALPVADTEEEQVARLETLQTQIHEANEEYRLAVERAKKLRDQLAVLLRTTLNSS